MTLIWKLRDLLVLKKTMKSFVFFLLSFFIKQFFFEYTYKMIESSNWFHRSSGTIINGKISKHVYNGFKFTFQFKKKLSSTICDKTNILYKIT